MVKPSASLDLEIPDQDASVDPVLAPKSYGLAIAAVLLAASCWSFIGVAYRLILDEYDVSPLTLISLRTSTAAVAVTLYVALRTDLRSELRRVTSLRNALPLLLAGMVSITGFNVALIYTFEEAGVAVGTVLLYFAPSIVALGAWLGLKHRISRIQRVALVLSLGGVVGVSGVISGGDNFQMLGLALGILSAVGYASYSLIGSVLLSRLHPLVIVGVSQSIGAVSAWTVTLIVEGAAIPEVSAIAWIVGGT